jgi:hypothetical protein
MAAGWDEAVAAVQREAQRQSAPPERKRPRLFGGGGMSG